MPQAVGMGSPPYRSHGQYELQHIAGSGAAVHGPDSEMEPARLCMTASTWTDEDREIVRKGQNFFHLMFMISVPAIVAAVEGGACHCRVSDASLRSALIHAPCECGCVRLATPALSSGLLRAQLELLPFIQRVPKERLSEAEYNASSKLKRCDVVMAGRARHARERGAGTYMAACGIEKPWSWVRSIYASLTGIDMATPHPRLQMSRRADAAPRLQALAHSAATAHRLSTWLPDADAALVGRSPLVALFQLREACAADPWRVGFTVRATASGATCGNWPRGFGFAHAAHLARNRLHRSTRPGIACTDPRGPE